MTENQTERTPEWLSVEVDDRRERAQFIALTTLIVMLLLLTLLWSRIVVVIPAGHRGVMYRLFFGGTQTDRAWGEGFHVIPPWDKLFDYETRLQEHTLDVAVLSSEGLELTVQTSARYYPHAETLGYLHRDIGPEYFDRLIKPEVEAHVRHTFGQRSAQELYSSQRDILQELARVPMLGRLNDDPEAESVEMPYIRLEELKLLNIKLPSVVIEAIAEKHRQQQMLLEYQFRLQREEQEAERKRTEAAGIRDYNRIADNISPNVLRWRGVEATFSLAQSQNTKVVVLGGGQQGGTSMLMNLFDAEHRAAASEPGAKAAEAPANGAAGNAAPPPNAPPPNAPPPNGPPNNAPAANP